MNMKSQVCRRRFGAALAVSALLATATSGPSIADSFPVASNGARCVNLVGVEPESYYRVVKFSNICDERYTVVMTIKWSGGVREMPKDVPAGGDGKPGIMTYPLTSSDESLVGWRVEF